MQQQPGLRLYRNDGVHPDIRRYNEAQRAGDREICQWLAGRVP